MINEKIYNLVMAVVKRDDIGITTKDMVLNELIPGTRTLNRPASPDDPMVINKTPGVLFTSSVDEVETVSRPQTDEEIQYRNDPKYKAAVDATEKDLDRFNEEE